jgi:hypothetical protein
VTAIGSPSGTATTIIVTPKMKKSKILAINYSVLNLSSLMTLVMVNWMVIATNVNKAQYIPTFPISSAILVNFDYNGVSELSELSSRAAYAIPA